MKKNEIMQELNVIFREIFNNQSIQLTDDTTASDIDEWDSLNHAVMISKVEKHFKIKFSLSEMLGFKNVGNLCETIEKKLLQQA